MRGTLGKRIGDTDPLLGTLGWRAVLLYCDPCAFDRWLWIRRNLQPGRVRTLDAGSGNGAFAMYAAQRGNEVVALSDSNADQAKAERRARALGLNGVDFRVRDLRQLDRSAAAIGRYDQVICLEVIEHIMDDRKLLRDLACVTRPGGRLLLTTPYRHHVPFFDEVMSGREDRHHVRWGYTHEEMAKLLVQAGFSVAAQGFTSGVVSQRITNLMQRLDRAYPHLGWVLTLPLRLLRPLDRPLTRLVGHPYLCLSVVAVRD
jgi:SAM-dependent methyltransferase